MSRRFWIGYKLFFIFIFPMIFEYAPMLDSGVDTYFYSAPLEAFAWLGLGCILWIIFISLYYRRYVASIGNSARHAQDIQANGIPTEARIIKQHILKTTKDFNLLELEISFKNLAGSHVRIPYEIADSKPYERRFAQGNKLAMLIDPQLRSPVIIPREAQVKKNTEAFTYYAAFWALIVFCIAYLIFSYWLQNQGMGWRFLHFWHPWLIIPICGISFGSVIRIFLQNKNLGSLFGPGQREKELIFKGKLAQAKLIHVSQTGTYINEQPEVKFELEFNDETGKTWHASTKKIVNLLDLANVNTPTRPILYLPENPQILLLADEYITHL